MPVLKIIKYSGFRRISRRRRRSPWGHKMGTGFKLDLNLGGAALAAFIFCLKRKTENVSN